MKKRQRDEGSAGAPSKSHQLFESWCFYFIAGGSLGRTKANLLADIAQRNGGVVLQALHPSHSKRHIALVTGLASVEKVSECPDGPSASTGIVMLRPEWISDSVEAGSVADVAGYLVPHAVSPVSCAPSHVVNSGSPDTEGPPPGSAQLAQPGFISVFFGDDESRNADDAATRTTTGVEWCDPEMHLAPVPLSPAQEQRMISIDRRKTFICQRPFPGAGSTPGAGSNEHLISELTKLQEIYEASGDKWREYSYSKAIGLIKRMDRKIESSRDLAHIRGFGERILAKIDEILATGTSTKLQFMEHSPQVQSLMVFSQIWGVGPAAARRLCQSGLHTLEELRRHPSLSTLLSPVQVTALRHYEDLILRIPRAEVRLIEEAVSKVIHSAFSNAKQLQVVTCGSYRRGKATSGDVDILVCDLSGTRMDGVLDEIVSKLHQTHLAVDDLSMSNKSKEESECSDTWFGVVQLPDCSDKEQCPCTHRIVEVDKKDMPNRFCQGSHLCRRLDIKVYPRALFPFAILYFTGSDYFNRSMRLYCQKKGMSLSDKDLKPVIRVSKEKVHEGAPIVCTTEKEIFAAVGLPYKEPWERDI